MRAHPQTSSNSRSPSSSSRSRGAVAAEFALLVPVLLMIIFGMVQIGLTYQRQEATHAAARETARFASLPTTSASEACAHGTNTLAGTNFTGTPTCTVAGDCSGASTNVVATITVDNDIEIPFLGSQTITLTGRGEFRCE